MNKTAIKNFSIWARNKLIADISYKAGLLGITEKEIKSPLPQSTQTVQFFDIGTKEPSSVTGVEIQQRKRLVEEIERKAKQSDYATAYKNVIEEVAYTWFNRLIAIRFMEVNDYLPTRIRVLSSESNGKAEPDLVTHALEANLDYSAYEKDRIIQLKHENKLDELFRMLFIKQCNALNANLPELFEKTSDYTELLLNVSFTDKEGVIYHLVNDIDEGDFNVSKEGQVEIIGWLYQYYNTEPKDETFALLKKNVKITKERIPAATQLFTPDWIVRYMVENSLGRIWLESHPNTIVKENWKYYLDEAEQMPVVAEKLRMLRSQSPVKSPEDIRLIDPCMGSGHILVYAFDLLMQIYESEGYNPRDAAKLILDKNIYGLDIDRRAYQLAYFSLIMKGRQYNRRILTEDIKPQVYYPAGFPDGEEYGSLVKVDALSEKPVEKIGQLSLEDTNYSLQLNSWNFKRLLTQKYDVVVTNPPYMGSSGMGTKMSAYIKMNYPDSKSDLFAVFIEKCGELLKPKGYQAMITQHAWMFLSSYEKLRVKMMHDDIVNMVHLGARAFEEIGGEVVQTTAFVLSKRNIENFRATYVRLIDYNSQQSKEEKFLSGSDHHIAKKENFEKMPGCPVAYWVSNSVISIFGDKKKISDFGRAMQGTISGDNNRFLRLWFEINVVKSSILDEKNFAIAKWIPHNKGGSWRRWYGNRDYVINWENDGFEIRNFYDSSHNLRSRPQNIDSFFKEGITWSDLSTSLIAVRYHPTGSAFDATGPTLVLQNPEYLNYILGAMNSKVYQLLLDITCPGLHYNNGVVNSMPVRIANAEYVKKISLLVAENVSSCKEDWDNFEISWAFKRHPLIRSERKVAAAFANLERELAERFDTLKANEEELNRIFIDIYSLQDELTPEVEDKDVTVRRADLGREIRSLISYAVGCMFGRYSLDVEGLVYAGGDWDNGKYITFNPDKDNVLPICDDEYFDDDIMGRFVDFVRVVYGVETLEENLKFIADALGGKGTPREVIRNYFLNDFYKDHCKIYQKRPIYWLFDSGKKNGFKSLVYLHRYQSDLLAKLRTDYVHEQQERYRTQLSHIATALNTATGSERAKLLKQQDKLSEQLKEITAFEEKVHHLADQNIEIDLDDGVKKNYEIFTDVLAKI